MTKKQAFFHPQRFFLDNVPKQTDGTCYVLNSEYGELWEAYGEQEKEIERLRGALERIDNYVKAESFVSHAATWRAMRTIATEALGKPPSHWMGGIPEPEGSRCNVQFTVEGETFACSLKNGHAGGHGRIELMSEPSPSTDPRHCPQCGPHPVESSETHARLHHTFEGLFGDDEKSGGSREG